MMEFLYVFDLINNLLDDPAFNQALGAFVILILTAALIVSNVIQELKERDILDDGEAGRAAGFANMFVALLITLTGYLGAEHLVPEAKDIALAVVEFGFLLVVLFPTSKALYLLQKWTGFFTQRSGPQQFQTISGMPYGPTGKQYRPEQDAVSFSSDRYKNTLQSSEMEQV